MARSDGRRMKKRGALHYPGAARGRIAAMWENAVIYHRFATVCLAAKHAKKSIGFGAWPNENCETGLQVLSSDYARFFYKLRRSL